MPPAEQVRGVVLAGGDSTRFAGGAKALATLDGRPLVAHVLEAVEAATGGPPVVAVGSTAEGDRLAAAPGVTVKTVTDAAAFGGPLAGLVAAARAVERPWLFVCGVDMPLVTADGVRALRDRIGATGTADAESPEVDGTDAVDAVVPVVDGHDQPLHALYRRESVLAAAGEVSASAGPRALLEAVAAVERVAADGVAAPLADAVTNVNTRADLEGIRDRFDG